MNEFPRILHVGFNPVGSSTNTGLTLGNMFGAWPRENLLEVYTVARQTAGIGPTAVLAPAMVAPIDAAARKVLGSRIPAPPSDGMNNSIAGRSSELPMRYRVRAAMATANEVGPVVVRGSWLDRIREFQPEAIHSLLGSVRMTKFVAGLSERLDIPVVPHFMDDWVSTMFADRQLGGVARGQVERSLRRVMSRAGIGLAIGQDMAREFEQRMGIPFVVVGNSVDFADPRWNREVRHEAVPSIVYAGGLHLGRDRPLRALAAAIDDVRDAHKARLVIHCPPADSARLAALVDAFPAVVEDGGLLAPSEVVPRLVAADVLAFVESDADAVARFTRLSVSTKVPEYLAARRPVVVMGPPGQSSVRALVEASGTAYADASSPTAVAGAVREALNLAEGTMPPLPNGIRELFDRTATQERLRRALLAGARGPI